MPLLLDDDGYLIMTEAPNIVPALPEIFVASVGMALLMLGVFQKVSDTAQEISRFGVGNNVMLVLVCLYVIEIIVSGFSRVGSNTKFL